MDARDLKLAHIHDDDKNYRIRVCMPVALAITHMPGSVQVPCDECGEDVWMDPHMPLPDADVQIDGDVNLCFKCVGIHAAVAKEPVKWIGPGAS